MEYVQGQIVEPIENGNANAKSKYKNGDIEANKIISYSLIDHPITYVYKMKKLKEMYDKLIGMYEVKNLSQIISLRIQFCDIIMKKYESITTYFMRISQIRDQLLSIEEVICDRELV